MKHACTSSIYCIPSCATPATVLRWGAAVDRSKSNTNLAKPVDRDQDCQEETCVPRRSQFIGTNSQCIGTRSQCTGTTWVAVLRYKIVRPSETAQLFIKAESLPRSCWFNQQLANSKHWLRQRYQRGKYTRCSCYLCHSLCNYLCLSVNCLCLCLSICLCHWICGIIRVRLGQG